MDKSEVIIKSIVKNLEYPQGYIFYTYRYITAEVRIGKLNIVIVITIDTYCGAILINRKFLKENIPTAIIEYIKDNNFLIIFNINSDKYISNKFVSIEIYF